MTYIFEALPIDTWKPKETDIERIRGWLLECPTTSEENQLARLLLAKLNYGAENVCLFFCRSASSIKNLIEWQ